MRVAGRAILLAIAVSLGAQAEAERYPVRLSRPMKVGNRYRIDSQGKLRERQRVTVNRQPAGNEEKTFEVRLVAVATVLAVDAKSLPTRISYAVDSCRKSVSGDTQEVMAPGSKVVAESKDGKTVFLVNGERASPEAAEALNLVLSAREPGSASDDEIFGTSERVSVGDKWNIHSEPAVRDLSKKGLTLAPADLTGSVRLEGVRTVGEVKALEISAQMRADKMGISTPPGVRLENASLESEFSGLVPADPERHDLLSDKVHIRIRFRMGGPKPSTGEKFVIDSETEIHVENNYSPAAEETHKPPSSPRS